MYDILLIIIGLVLLNLSLALNIIRTKDYSILTTIWASTEDLSTLELWINRTGFIIVIIGIILYFLP